MPELFQEMNCGPNVQNVIESDECKVMRLSDSSGEGMMTLYYVFPGVFLMYNDFHMKECVSGFQTNMDLSTGHRLVWRLSNLLLIVRKHSNILLTFSYKCSFVIY